MTDLKVTANMNCFGNNVGLLCFKPKIRKQSQWQSQLQ